MFMCARRAGGRAAVAGGGDAERRGARVAGGRGGAEPLAGRAGRARARLPLLQPVRATLALHLSGMVDRAIVSVLPVVVSFLCNYKFFSRFM